MKSATVWAGPSRLDFKPIIVRVTGLDKPSQNEKTGGMVQVFILRADVSPLEALKTGEDASVCGSCKHRPTPVPETGKVERSCYVNLGQSVRSTWDASQRQDMVPLEDVVEEIRTRGLQVRLGAYGNPSAAPFHVMRALAMAGKGWTGYVHDWPDMSPAQAKKWQTLCMASVDSEEEREAAQAKGWRTFRVVSVGHEVSPVREVECMADSRGLTCEQCGACNGRPTERNPVSIWITAHGSGAKHVR